MINKMIFYNTLVLVLFYITKIGGKESLQFRFDYTFNEEANRWLKFHQVPETWNDAKDRCKFEGAILASPVNPTVQEVLLKYVANLTSDVDAIFTGVHATFSQGDYSSVEGLSLQGMEDWINWAPGEPNNLDNSEQCLAMMPRHNGALADVKCNEARPFVCYRKRTELKMTECGTYDQEYKLERTGNCYKLHKPNLSWHKAFTACTAEGAYLAVVNSQDESSLLREIIVRFRYQELFKNAASVCHVGLYNSRDSGPWMTVHGQTITEAGYDEWGSNQPNNDTSLAPEGEACGGISTDGRYSDVWCGLTSPFFCEKSPNSLM